MRRDVVAQLLALNQRFYDSLADPFAQSRQRPQPGFFELLTYLPQTPVRVLDVGCGNGRFGTFLAERDLLAAYTGVDFSAELLAKARERGLGTFVQRDMSQPGCLDGLGEFDIIGCLAAMQHLPGHANRVRLLAEMKTHLAVNGRIFLANWQFMDSARQRRKVTEWREVGLTAADVEPNDYLLTWQRGGFGLRYVCMIDAEETAVLADAAGLQIHAQFRSDGKEGNLSLYTVLTANNQHASANG